MNRLEVTLPWEVADQGCALDIRVEGTQMFVRASTYEDEWHGPYEMRQVL